LDIDLSEQQEMLRNAARYFLKAKYPMSLAKKLIAEDTGCPPEIWVEIARQGWLGLIFPQENGGEGGNFLDFVILCEELGSACFMGPP